MATGGLGGTFFFMKGGFGIECPALSVRYGGVVFGSRTVSGECAVASRLTTVNQVPCAVRTSATEQIALWSLQTVMRI